MELHILGTRGIPATHGGFETFAEQLSLFLVSKGHHVTVYCQLGPNEPEFTDIWRDVYRVGLSEKTGPLGTISFDFRSALIASRHRNATILTLGYNTAIFSVIHRFRGVHHLMNMDGIEWKRQKWGRAQRLWLRVNEWCGSHLANALVADHPEIKNHLSPSVPSEKITVIPYGADTIEQADSEIVHKLGLEVGKYFLLVARPEPENSVLDIVKAYAQKPRSFRLVILGKYLPDQIPYHAEVLKTSENTGILFPGSIYDTAKLQALRLHAAAYLHGHQVGGTNPSLVESLAAGNAVIAHDNRFNRWVAGPNARYFSSVDQLVIHFDELQENPWLLEKMRSESKLRHNLYFKREPVLEAYEQLLLGSQLQENIWSLSADDLGRTATAKRYSDRSTDPAPDVLIRR